MLSESRKYRLCLTPSHQLTRQLDQATYQSVVGNCGTMLAFRVGMEDAEQLAPAFSKHSGQLGSGDLCNFPNHTAYVQLLTPDGQPSRPFSLRTLATQAPTDSDGRAEIVRRTSARQGATDTGLQRRRVPCFRANNQIVPAFRLDWTPATFPEFPPGPAVYT
jgi:hypothetical protein